MFNKIFPVIMCGGSGTRLWPLSRTGNPKQFLSLNGDKSMLVQTVERVGQQYGFSKPLIIANQQQRFIVHQQLENAGLETSKILLEPIGRDTAPAAILAALEVQAIEPKAKLLLLPADHKIADLPAFHQAVETAARTADSGFLVCFGIVPNRIEPGFGYIKPAEALPHGAHGIMSFHEKPDILTAQDYFESGEYLWNSGMFMFNAAQIIEEAARHAPEMLEACKTAHAGIYEKFEFHHLSEADFSSVPADSIDCAILERTNRAAVVLCELGWSDLGSFSALYDHGDKDDEMNVTHGEVVLQNSKNCFVHTDRNLVAATNIEDLVVVATDDAILIAPKSQDQNIKELVQTLSADNRSEVNFHTTVYRPWGYFRSLAINDAYQVKELCVYPGKRLSLQSHEARAEHWIIIGGEATVTYNDDVLSLRVNESIFLPKQTRHRLQNNGDKNLQLIEVQTGTYFGEDDIVRYEDDFQRT